MSASPTATSGVAARPADGTARPPASAISRGRDLGVMSADDASAGACDRGTLPVFRGSQMRPYPLDSVRRDQDLDRGRGTRRRRGLCAAAGRAGGARWGRLDPRRPGRPAPHRRADARHRRGLAAGGAGRRAVVDGLPRRRRAPRPRVPRWSAGRPARARGRARALRDRRRRPGAPPAGHARPATADDPDGNGRDRDRRAWSWCCRGATPPRARRGGACSAPSWPPAARWRCSRARCCSPARLGRSRSNRRSVGRCSRRSPPSRAPS